MKYRNTFKLKDGRTCIVRNADEHDGERVLANFLLTHEQTDFLASYPDECTYTAEEESAFLKKKTESEREVELVCEVESRIVATAGISSTGKHEKMRHRAEFGISVEKDYWGLGIGRMLTNACIECARKAGYAQLELEVVGDNERAISLYKKAGFVEYGRNPKGFISRFSGPQELVHMLLKLD